MTRTTLATYSAFPSLFAMDKDGAMEFSHYARVTRNPVHIVWLGRNRPAYVERLTSPGATPHRWRVTVRSADRQRDDAHEAIGSFLQVVASLWGHRGDDYDCDPKAEEAGRTAFQSISGAMSDGKFFREPRCPYRKPERIAAWLRGYDEMRTAFDAAYA